jgi:hypothetical protein
MLSQGGTALFYATKYEKFDMVKKLVREGANIALFNKVSRENYVREPFNQLFQLRNGFLETVQHKTTALILACECGFADIAEFLIEPFKAAGLLNEGNVVSPYDLVIPIFPYSGQTHADVPITEQHNSTQIRQGEKHSWCGGETHPGWGT